MALIDLYAKVNNYKRSYQFPKVIKNTYDMVMERRKTRDKIVVAFVVQYLPSWNKMERVYQELMRDDAFEVHLLCVPDDVSSMANANYEFFASQGVPCINAKTKDGWFDLKSLEPDYVFHSRPYNFYLPECYRSNVVAEYALVVNILYAASISVAGQKLTLNREFFNSVFCYFAFDKYEQKFYERRFAPGIKKGYQYCYPYGGSGLEDILKAKMDRAEVNQEISNLGETEEKQLKEMDLLNLAKDFPFVVMWTPRWSTDKKAGGSNFFNYKNLFESLIREYPDTLFIIRPHPLMFQNFISTGEMSEKEVEDFKSFCRDTKNVHLDQDKDYTKTFWISDALLTDGSGIMPEYYVTEKPMVYCTSNIKGPFAEFCNRLFDYSYVVDTEAELRETFIKLHDGKDEKKEGRHQSVLDIFGDVENSSVNVVKTLKELVK